METWQITLLITILAVTVLEAIAIWYTQQQKSKQTRCHRKLIYEITKTLKHIIYNLETENEIIASAVKTQKPLTQTQRIMA